MVAQLEVGKICQLARGGPVQRRPVQLDLHGHFTAQRGGTLQIGRGADVGTHVIEILDQVGTKGVFEMGAVDPADADAHQYHKQYRHADEQQQ